MAEGLDTRERARSLARRLLFGYWLDHILCEEDSRFVASLISGAEAKRGHEAINPMAYISSMRALSQDLFEHLLHLTG